jgi:hypothetical protein
VRPRGGAGQGGDRWGSPRTSVDGKVMQAVAFNGRWGAPGVSGDEGMALQLRGGRER